MPGYDSLFEAVQDAGGPAAMVTDRQVRLRLLRPDRSSRMRSPAGARCGFAVSSPTDVEVVDEPGADATGQHRAVAVHGTPSRSTEGRLTDTASSPSRTNQMPGSRLWLYTNFHCNLSCDYCCVSSSPGAEPWALSAEQVARLVDAGMATGVQEIFLTGGEPFLNQDIAQIVATCVAVAPTVMLTNGMVLKGARLAWLEAMPRDNLILQISVDSATPDLHDLHRGEGSWAKAIAGVRTAKERGFAVRLAATLSTETVGEEPRWPPCAPTWDWRRSR